MGLRTCKKIYMRYKLLYLKIIFSDVANHVFIKFALCGISCLENDVVDKYFLLCSVVFKVVGVVAIVGSVVIL